MILQFLHKFPIFCGNLRYFQFHRSTKSWSRKIFRGFHNTYDVARRLLLLLFLWFMVIGSSFHVFLFLDCENYWLHCFSNYYKGFPHMRYPCQRVVCCCSCFCDLWSLSVLSLVLFLCFFFSFFWLWELVLLARFFKLLSLEFFGLRLRVARTSQFWLESYRDQW